MSIRTISEEMMPDPMRIGKSSGTAKKQGGEQDAGRIEGRDATDVSRLSKIMARSTKNMEEETSVRPEKLEKFKSIVNQDVDLTDEQVDTILDRMIKV